MTPKEIKKAISLATTGSAPGVDGIPNDLWKKLEAMAEEDRKKETPTFCLPSTMAVVFNDIID
jgi:hypothetical protein